jgi:hypothetical protein
MLRIFDIFEHEREREKERERGMQAGRQKDR